MRAQRPLTKIAQLETEPEFEHKAFGPRAHTNGLSTDEVTAAGLVTSFYPD